MFVLSSTPKKSKQASQPATKRTDEKSKVLVDVRQVQRKGIREREIINKRMCT